MLFAKIGGEFVHGTMEPLFLDLYRDLNYDVRRRATIKMEPDVMVFRLVNQVPVFLRGLTNNHWKKGPSVGIPVLVMFHLSLSVVGYHCYGTQQ